MRLIILSNRLQVTVTEDKGKLIFEPSAGGLATGIRSWLAGVSDMEYLWMGWPGAGPYSDREDLRTLLLDKYHSIPVFVEEKKMDLFYHGFCNKALWPLFHYFPALTVFDEKMWEIYREVNAVFADALLRILRPDDVLWVHDYHFLLVPELIKKAMPDISVGFFLHIPFPEYEIFRLLPRKWGKEILSGMLGADLVGFHTYDYMHYFLRCVLRVMGLDHDMGVIDLGHKYTRAGAFPMGIDFDTYALASKLSAVKKEHSLLEKEVRDLKVILSVDRQDYTKGILNRLEGYESFLEKNPVWRGNVVLVMIVVPSRVDVEQYQREKYVINQTVGNINGTYGNIHWTPVIYQYRAIQFEQLAALYNRSDVALVTPLRDGMNLVAKEFVAAQTEKRGVLILSEMAGAALELGEAVIINPHNREEIADAIKIALEMPKDEQARRIQAMQERLRKYDITKWVEDFLAELGRVKKLQKKSGAVTLEGRELDAVLYRFRKADRRLLFLDHDGTLVPFAGRPEEASPGRRNFRILKALVGLPNLRVVIISGRLKRDLERWYGRFGVTLVAEHGAFVREPGLEWRLSKPLDKSWKPEILQIMEKYSDRLPGSFIEEKEYSAVWHFRNAERAASELRVREFVDDMVRLTARNEIEIMMGNKVVEVKCSGIDKGVAAGLLLGGKKAGFIMAAGDDETDESMFRAMPDGSVCVRIGRRTTAAGFFVESSRKFLEALEMMAGPPKNIFAKVREFFTRR